MMERHLLFARYYNMAAAVRDAEHPYPEGRFAGRGIVTCGGGKKYFTTAWVLINMLRKVGCTLPIELWYLGDKEMSDEMRKLVQPLGVTCIDGQKVAEREGYCQGNKKLGGWELKSFSITYSAFEHVIFLDSDNVPLADPEFFFDTKQYAATGAIFWPDYGRLARGRGIWTICRVPYRNEPEFESGQIVVDKSRCWKALQLTMHMNEQSDFYYKHVLGDKETFHMAWRMLEQEYTMVPYAIHKLRKVMCQHDFDGNIIFQHRNMDKWRLDGENLRIHGFQREEECMEIVSHLRKQWSGRVEPPPQYAGPLSPLYHEITRTGWYIFRRVHQDRRVLQFLPDQTMGKGATVNETEWKLETRNDKPCLVISDGQTDSAVLHLQSDASGIFIGSYSTGKGTTGTIELIPAREEDVRPFVGPKVKLKSRKKSGKHIPTLLEYGDPVPGKIADIPTARDIRVGAQKIVRVINGKRYMINTAEIDRRRRKHNGNGK
jgi:hypothetical protein